MAMWDNCAICGRAIPIGEPCYGVKNWRGDPIGGDTICRDCLVLENVPTLTPPNEWVSVEERLPAPGERVLATDCGFVGEFYINKRGKWQRYNVNCSELLMALDILYWMPLPAPPEKE